MYFRNIVFCSLIVAVVASTAFGIYQNRMITPIILEAEKYEIIDQGHAGQNGPAEGDKAWGPEEGLQRTGFTYAANFLAAYGFSMLLICGMSMVGKASIMKGGFWGGAGYLACFVAPGVGLSPEIPGMQAADLDVRQGWWLMTVVMTSVGLAALVFGDLYLKLGGVAALVIPQFIGPPVVEMHGFTHPDANVIKILEDLWHQFVLQTYIANALLWIIMGLLSGVLVKNYIDNLDESVTQ